VGQFAIELGWNRGYHRHGRDLLRQRLCS
jgi:hypothetical protein